MEHDVLWEVLKDQGLHSDYIDIIKRLYDGQTAYVQAGAASRRFPLLRGVKQGDPVSALLFIAVMEQCFRSLKKRWKREVWPQNASRENEDSFEYPARRATRVLNSWNYFHRSFEGRGSRKISWEEAYPGPLSCNRASEQDFSWLGFVHEA